MTCIDCNDNQKKTRCKNRCSVCYGRFWRIKNKEHIKEYNRCKYPSYYEKNKDKIKKQTSKYSKDNYEQTKYFRIKKNAIKRGIIFNLNKNIFIKMIQEATKCEYCGVILKKNIGKINNDALSVDRKDNNKGYEDNNLAICCFLCNAVKNNIFNYYEMKKIGGIIKKARRRLK